MSEKIKKKGFFAKHARSSAFIVTVSLHLVLFLVAGTIVAVKTYQREDKQFEAKRVSRPKAQLKKLQVPVKVKKSRPKPKLSKRIVVKDVKQSTPEFKMPEISGVKGALGSLGASGMESIGFAMPEINLFGTKSKGEKVFIVLNASGNMLADELGGIPAYSIIKSELVRILEGLNPAVVFNIAVYGKGKDEHSVLFPSLVPATPANVAKVEQWLKPLNVYKKGKKAEYGTKTLGEGGSFISEKFKIDPLKGETGDWTKGAFLAMKQQADVVFILTSGFGSQINYATEQEGRQWTSSDWKNWRETVSKAKRKLNEENERRLEAGKPPKVISAQNNDEIDKKIVRTYFPGTPTPPGKKYESYTARELIEAFDNTRKKWQASDKLSLGLSKKKQENYTINIIHFVPAEDGKTSKALNDLADITRGSYSMVEGMAAIKSYVEAEPQTQKKK